MKTRILYVNTSGRICGAENSLLELVRALDRSRFVPLAAVPESGRLADLLERAGCRTVGIPELRFRRTCSPTHLLKMGSRWVRACLAVIQAAKLWNVGLIHSNSTSAHMVGGCAALLSRTPALWHVRDMQQVPLLEYLTDRSTCGVIYCSEATRSEVPLSRLDGVDRYVIHNALDADQFRRQAEPGTFRRELGVGPETQVVLMAAQLVPWKGHADIIRAMELLEPDQDVRLILAGADMFGEHQEYVEKLRRHVGRTNLTDSVTFVGHRENVATLMADSNVIVVPSRNEPFGRVALEAMALEKPVIATNDAGLAEIVQDEETGFLVPPGDPERLAEAIDEVTSDPEGAQRMGRAGYKRVKSEFNIQKHTRRVEQVYETLTGAII